MARRLEKVGLIGEGDAHVFLSGTKVRELLGEGQLPPAEFSRPEVAAILIEAYRSAS